MSVMIVGCNHSSENYQTNDIPSCKMPPHCFLTITISQDIVSPNKKSLKRKRESSDVGNGVCRKRSALKDITNVSIFLTWIIALN